MRAGTVSTPATPEPDALLALKVRSGESASTPAMPTSGTRPSTNCVACKTAHGELDKRGQAGRTGWVGIDTLVAHNAPAGGLRRRCGRRRWTSRPRRAAPSRLSAPVVREEVLGTGELVAFVATRGVDSVRLGSNRARDEPPRAHATRAHRATTPPHRRTPRAPPTRRARGRCPTWGARRCWKETATGRLPAPRLSTRLLPPRRRLTPSRTPTPRTARRWSCRRAP